jgi:hypothetical protein
MSRELTVNPLKPDPLEQSASDNSPYPLPFHAATIWTSGDHLWLVLGPTERDGRANRVTLPATESGLRTALRILKDRELTGVLPIGASDGSCDQALAIHMRRHQIWASPMCPHCRAEGRVTKGGERVRQSKYFAVKRLGDVTVRKIRPGVTAKQAAQNAPAVIEGESLDDLGL